MRVAGALPALRAALARGAWGCALALFLLVACKGEAPVTPPGGDGGSVTPGPGGNTPPPALTPTRTPSPETTLLLVKEFGANADTLRLVDPRDPSRSRAVLTIEHAEGWGARVAISPDGRRVAYAVLPRGARDERLQAELWVAPLDGGAPVRQATGIDLRGGALWAADGSAVFARRNEGNAVQVLRVDQRAGSQPQAIPAGAGVASLTLAGAHGRYIYWAEFSLETGRSVLRVYDVQSGQASASLTLAQEPARDLALSPDGARLAFVGANTLKAFLADLSGRTVSELATGGQPALQPAWLPDASAVAFGLAPQGSQPGRLVLFGTGGSRDLLSLSRGFLQPLTWAPDGSYLVCYYYTGTLANPGTPAVVTVTADGRQASLPVAGEAEIVGWARGRL